MNKIKLNTLGAALAGISLLPLSFGYVQAETSPQLQMLSEQPPEQANPAAFTRSEAEYALPNVQVVRQDGKKFAFPKALTDGRIVALNFIYASCNTICPMSSHLFASVQNKLGGDAKKVHLVSVTLDPENDSPAKLAEYAKKFGGKPGWDHYTGSMNASIAIQKAFNAFRGDKMNHAPVIFIQNPSGKSWIKMDGFVSANDVVGEIQQLSALTKS